MGEARAMEDLRALDKMAGEKGAKAPKGKVGAASVIYLWVMSKPTFKNPCRNKLIHLACPLGCRWREVVRS